MSEVVCFSFYATKSITCGESGAVSTSHERLWELPQKLWLHGMSRDALHRYTEFYRHYDVDIEGWKYNMYSSQAPMLIDQIDEIDPAVKNGNGWSIIIAPVLQIARFGIADP